MNGSMVSRQSILRRKQKRGQSSSLMTVSKHNHAHQRILNVLQSLLEVSPDNVLKLLLQQTRLTWEQYLQLVLRYQPLLERTDDFVRQILFFLWPHHEPDDDDDGTTGHHWVQVIFGLLQWNQLSIDLAHRKQQQRQEGKDSNESSSNPFGASVTVPIVSIGSTSSGPSTSFPAVGIRIALTILQCLWPMVQELIVRPSANTLDQTFTNASLQRKQASLQCLLERIRFLLRFSLLFQYWKSFEGVSKQYVEGNSEWGDSLVPGLLLDGGQYLSASPMHGSPTTVEEEAKRLERTHYVGRRTGRTTRKPSIGHPVRQQLGGNDIGEEEPNTPVAGDSFLSMLFSKMTPKTRVRVGEMLYILRPLVQAEAQKRTSRTSGSLYKILGVCLSMDVLSLLALKNSHGAENDGSLLSAGTKSLSKEEWDRRRFRLWLYLVRSPIWDQITRPGVERVSNGAGYIPLLGSLLQNYLWDWLYYWKLYRAEEG